MQREQIIQHITDICPYKDGLKINFNKNGNTSVFLYGVRAMQVSMVSKCETISFQATDVSDPAFYGIPYKALKSPEPNIRFEIHSRDDIQRLNELIVEVFNRCRLEAPVDSFGCCSSFTACSDAKQCLHLGDPTYWGCLYRRNLERNRIFYGKNKNYPPE